MIRPFQVPDKLDALIQDLEWSSREFGVAATKDDPAEVIQAYTNLAQSRTKLYEYFRRVLPKQAGHHITKRF